MKLKSYILHSVLYIADLFILLIIYNKGYFQASPLLIYFLAGYILFKGTVHLAIVKFFVSKNIQSLQGILDSFQKGRYTFTDKEFPVKQDWYLEDVVYKIKETGKYLDNLVNTQHNEISQFRELYNNIVLSANSYFLVCTEKEEVIFVNKSFSHCFNYDSDDVIGKRLTDIFYIPPGRLKNAIETVRTKGGTFVLRKIKLLSRKKKSIIADIKISRITEQGDNQIIMVLDDITSQWRKDYQISLISQISESIQKDHEIDRVLLSILGAVTSGSGLGFNRAMFFLYDEDKDALVGSMAIGPDSVEEAGKIWDSLAGDAGETLVGYDEGGSSINREGRFYKKVVGTVFSCDNDNLFIDSWRNNRSIHIYNSLSDERVDPAIREYMDVKEFVIVPLCSSSHNLGIIVVDNKFNSAPIYDDHVELLSIFAFQAALTIDSYNMLKLLQSKMDQLKERQEAIVESEKLAAVGRIAAHIAHEIRNPLVTVGGYARRILQLVKRNPKELDGVEKASTIILHESERLEKILSNVMDFSRPSPQIRDYNNINDVVQDTCSLLNNVFQERKINLVLDLKDKLPLVKSDFNQLKQVVLNLVQNAMDASPQGSTINISTFIEGEGLFVSVKDEGEGIPPEKIGTIFEPFFTTKITGVGLGLAVVKKIINDHNGEINARNNPDKGAEFYIEFPIPG
jgi:PAS domain S-box-containing protein